MGSIGPPLPSAMHGGGGGGAPGGGGGPGGKGQWDGDDPPVLMHGNGWGLWDGDPGVPKIILRNSGCRNPNSKKTVCTATLACIPMLGHQQSMSV